MSSPAQKLASPAQELVDQALRKLPEDEPGERGPEWQSAEDAVIACRRLEKMLQVYPPAQVVLGLEIVERLLCECAPAVAIEGLRKWRAERMGLGRALTAAEVRALTVAGVIAGGEP